MEGSSSSGNNGQESNMPTTTVMQIIDKALPDHARVSDEAKEFVVQCISKFISHVTGQARHYCQAQLRKTITAEDILVAMSNLKLDNYVNALDIYLTKYREQEARRISASGERFLGRRVRYTPLISRRQVRPSPPTSYGPHPPPIFRVVVNGNGQIELGVPYGPPLAESASPANYGRRLLAHFPMKEIYMNSMAMRGGHVGSSSLSSSENSSANTDGDNGKNN